MSDFYELHKKMLQKYGSESSANEGKKQKATQSRPETPRNAYVTSDGGKTDAYKNFMNLHKSIQKKYEKVKAGPETAPSTPVMKIAPVLASNSQKTNPAYTPTRTRQEYETAISSGKQELSRLEELLGKKQDLGTFLRNTYTMTPAAAAAQEAAEQDGWAKEYGYGSWSEAQNRYEILQRDVEQLEREQKFGYLSEDADYDYYRGLGASVENPEMEEAEKWIGGKEIGNIVTYSRANAEAIAVGEVNNSRMQGRSIYTYMLDEEVSNYNYLLAREGAEAAQEYLDFLEPTLQERQAEQWTESLQGIRNPVGKVVAQGAFGVAAGVDRALGGMKQSVNKEALPQNATQHTSENLQEDMGTVGRIFYSAAENIGHMVPSILVSALFGGAGAPTAIAQTAGSLAMGAGVGGNAYAEAIADGYSDTQARNYGLLVGASEALLQKAIGGISSLGGMSETKLMSKIATFDNALLRGASRFGVNLAGEITEEELQNFLEPAIRSVLFGEEYDAPTVDELIETALVTALTVGALEGPTTIAQTATEEQTKNSAYREALPELVAESGELSGETELGTRIQEQMDAGQKVATRDINRLVAQNEAAIAEQTTAQAAEKLAQKGMTEGVEEAAVVVAKMLTGKRLTSAERTMVRENTAISEVVTEMENDWQPEGTEVQRTEPEAELVPSVDESFSEEALPNIPDRPYQSTPEETESAPATEEPVTSTDAAQANEIPDETNLAEKDHALLLEKASQKYGDQAGAMIHTYIDGQNVAKYDMAYQSAYDMGKSGVSITYVKESDSTSYLSDTQRELAYEAGVAAASSAAIEQDNKNKAKVNGKAGRKKGVIKGEGVTIADLKESFNDPQGKAYKYLSAVAEVTGIDIVLYKSEANETGIFEESQGKFKWSEDKIYIDINAGVYYAKDVNELSKYAMLRTFAHEFTHFIEKWNPLQYNEFRKVVFNTLTERGENVHDLIEQKRVMDSDISYDQASREVVAEAMTDILPDANFVQELAQKHKTIFQKLLEKMKEFVDNLRGYFNALAKNPSRESNAIKEEVGESVQYLESIVRLFDNVAVEAVEAYQKTVAVDEAKAEAPVETKAETSLDEEAALMAYKSGGSYMLNAKLREDMELTPMEQQIVDGLDSALRKLPVYNGTVYRNLIFDGMGDQEARDEFAAAHVAGEISPNLAYTSTSTRVDGYPVEGEFVAHMVIESVSGRNMEGYGNNFESEVLFPRNTYFLTTKIEYSEDGTPTIYQKEVEHGRKGNQETLPGDPGRKPVRETGAAETDKMREMQEQSAGSADLSPVSEGDPGQHPGRKGDLSEVSGEVTPTTVTEPTPEGVGEYADIYDRLRSAIGNLSRYWTSGFLFRVYKVNGKWEGHVDAAEQHDGYEIANARGVHYTSELYDTRDDAVEDIIAVARNNRLLDPMDADTTRKTEEVKTNGNEEETGTVLPHRGDGQGTARLLGEVEAADVQGNGTERDPVADAGERGDQAGRHDLGTDAGTRHERGHGEGSSQGGDLQRDGGRDRGTGRDGSGSTQPGDVQPVRGDSAPGGRGISSEEIAEQVEQQSTEQPKGKNFVIGDSLNLPNGEKARYKANVDAIRLVKQLEAENRYATPAEQEILSKYVGWGGLANAFDQRKADWNKEYAELKELLTDEEYSLARGSTLNAHYTDISVIKAMYDGLAGLGFDGGRLMEPSAGVGNFVGAMPPAMSAKVKSWTMVELDSITGKIAKYLYPNADVRIQGFEKANIPNNFMDVAISNVPFGNYAIADKSYPKKVTSAIHNYFFAKAIDKVRPGGIVMFITSSYTMNSRDNTVRKYMMQRADLLGAIRLPDTAFKGNAGTEVVTDILILKKRAANTEYAGEEFLEAPWTRPVPNNYNGAYINTYFENHPEMVLGTPSMAGSMYRGESLTYKAFTDKGSLADQIREAFTHITGKMDYPAKTSPEKTNFAVERAGKKAKKNSLVVQDGKVYQNTDNGLEEVKVPKGAAERISGMLELRDAAKELMTYQQQGLKDTEIKKARAKLNKLYDAFVKKHGYINSQANRNAMKDDPYKYSIFALENYDPETKKGTKADIFSKNTIAPNRTVTSVKDVAEGLIVSVNQTGGVDAALIAKLTGMSEEAVTRELLDSRQAFKNRDGVLEPAEVYLSGNVRAKLRDAEALAPIDADYQKNVESLRAVVPEDVPYQDIFVNPGTPWIPNSVYSDFAAYMLGGRNTEWRTAVEVTRNPETGNFTVELKERYLKTNAANTQKWGTPRRSFLELFDAMLNSRSVVVKIKLDDGTTVVDKDATAAANEKIENIQKEFQEWLWRDEARRNDLVYLYNETFNAIVTPKYNGDNLTVNGANAMKPLRPHQRNAVQRVISSGGNTLLAHKVGAGKTYEMAAAAMKLKELGLVKKPMFAVPKSLVAQWGTEFMDFFPTAKLLVAEASDFTAANRKVFMNRIANGDYDAVIVSYEQFERLPISNDFERELYQEQIDSIISAIEEAKAEKGGKALSVKDLEKKRKSLQTKIDKLADSAKDEDNIDFEQLGVDSLFIDEAHNFKNLFYTTSMTNVAGLGNKDGSKRAFDLYTKVRYLQKLNGGRGIVFATATPVMNSMSEMYIMQKYLQPDLLDQLGLSTFDAWAKQFGEVVNGVEIKPSGQGYRVKQSFSRFKNMSELQLLFRNFADVLTDIPGLKIPKMKGGKVNVVVCEPGEFQQDYMKELEKRADNVKNVDPSVDNMLKITSDGRKISYTQRMIDPTLPYEEGSKIYRCAENVARVYEEDQANKGTQLIFCDMATPKGKSSTAATEAEETETDMESAKLYDDIKTRLIEMGIPASEIAFIHDADTDAKKKKLFADVNDGKVRVLIGSTGKMGVGMNAQKRVAAIHHLDAPWRPGDVEQRNGRAFRQGNIHDEVECFTYVTEGSFDARLWDILERKQNFINQVMNGENVGRETEDTGEVTLSAAEVKALASGSPLIMEQVQLDTDIKKLESLYRAHNAAVASAKLRLESDKGTIANLEKRIANGKIDLRSRVDTYSEGKFSMTIGKQKYTDPKEAGKALMASAVGNATEEGYTTIGKFAGFELQVVKTYEGIKGRVAGAQGYSFKTYPGNTTYMITQLISVVEGIDDTMAQWGKDLEATRADMAEQEKLIDAPFTKQDELAQKRARYNEVMAILNPKEEQALGTMDEDTVQEQSRGYLDANKEQYQERTNTLTDREVLTLAAEQVKVDNLTDAERDALNIFQKRLGKLADLEEQRAEQGRLYKEQQFGTKVDRTAAAETLERMKVLDAQIQNASKDVLTVEEKTVLRNVLKKARKVVENQQWTHDQEILRRWRDRRNNAEAVKKYRERVRRDVDELTKWVLHPSNKDVVKHIPDALKNSVIPFLASIDFSSKQSLRGGKATLADRDFQKQLKSLKAALRQNIDSYGLYSGYNDLPPYFMDSLQIFIDTVDAIISKNSGEYVIHQMTSEELKALSKVVHTLKKYIQQFNVFHANAMFRHVYEAGDATVNSLAAMKNASSHVGNLSNFALWQHIRPAYAFERFGDGGKAIYDELREGQAKLSFNTKAIVDFANKTYTAKEVAAWDKEIKHIQLGNDVVLMKVSQIMSFYELSKRPQALKHILGNGIRVATFQNGMQKIADVGHVVTPSDMQTMISALSDRQKEVADKLQNFMAMQGGAWGNYVSVKRFGEELFGEEHYFPINSDGRHLQSNADEAPGAASLYALLNISFTKELQENANNRIILYSIFDVFSNHMASMAQYNAFALPMLDALKWFNYQMKSDPDENGKRVVLGSVRDQMARVYGAPEESRPGSGKKGYAEVFVENILKAFNGTEAQGTPYDSFGMKSLHKYNRAQIAYNFRVVIQQPLAITRAAMIVDFRSIAQGIKLSPTAIRQNIAEMQKYSGIAAWKSLGFYDVNISRGLTAIIKHDESTLDRTIELGTKGAEYADQLTWAAIWGACKTEVIRKQHLRPKDAGFFESVTQLFEEVVYKTQVVDSVLTKSEFMRDKGTFARLVGSFMSEPTTTASMLVDAVDRYNRDLQKGMSKQAAWKKNGANIARTIYVYSLGQVLLASAQAVADAMRDDDDYKDFLEKWLDAFKGNVVDELMPLNKLPILSDFYDLAKELIPIFFDIDIYGNPPQSVFMQWYNSLIQGTEILHKKIVGAQTGYTWYGGVYKMLQAVSGMTGLPMATFTRDVVTAWNTLIGGMAPSLKIKTYDPGDRQRIQEAFESGYLTEEEAAKELEKAKVVDSNGDPISYKGTAAYWAYKAENPDADVESTWFEKYHDDGNAKSAGIKMETYLEYRQKAKGKQSKKDLLPIIHGMNLTRSQKDALYREHTNWSEEALSEAPWH